MLSGRTYRPDTATLVTTWTVDGGELELADGLVAEVEGRFLPATVLVRRLAARGRTVPRPASPRPPIRLRAPARAARSLGEPVRWCANTGTSPSPSPPTAPRVEVDRPVEFEVRPGQPVTIVVTVARHRPLIVVPPAVAAAELARDEAGWRAWAAGIERHRSPRRGRAQPDHAAAAHLLAVRRPGRRPDHLAARTDRRRPQLGLPLRLAARRVDRHRRLPRRRQTAGGPRLPRLAPPRQSPVAAAPAGAVHPRRTARAPRDRARPGGPATPTAARSASATAPPTSISSTATAGFSTPPGSSPTPATASTARPGGRSPAWPTRSPPPGPNPTPGSGSGGPHPPITSTPS